MSSNQPPFDPLNATDAEEREIMDGYRAAFRGEPLPPDATLAFEHGYRNGRSDTTGNVDPEQRETAARYLRLKEQAR